MILLDRYLIRGSLVFISLALLLLAGLDTLFALIAELEDLQHSYGYLQAAVYIGLTTPRRIYEFLPVSVLIGTLFSLGQMAQQSELIVMRAAGFSVYRIVGACLKASFLFVVLALLLSQFLVPYTQQYAQSYRAIKQGESGVLYVRQGNWQKEANLLIHVAALAPNNVLQGVTRFQFDDQQQLQTMTYSAQADHHTDHWVLKQNRQTTLSPEKIQTQIVENLEWPTQLNPEAMAMVIMEPEYLSITGLYHYAKFLQQQSLRYQPYALAFWKKILQPLASLVMVILAISFIFGPLRSVTMGFRIVSGLIAGMTFYYLQDLMGYLSLVFDVPAFGAALLPVIPFALVAWHLLKRIN